MCSNFLWFIIFKVFLFLVSIRIKNPSFPLWSPKNLFLRRRILFMQAIQISFRTAPELPPPHAFQAEIDIQVQDNRLAVRFLRLFIERDLLEKEEIEAEGFSHDDDFEWTGFLPQVWREELHRLAGNTQLVAEEPRQLYVVIQDGIKSSGRPEPEADWILFTEQMIQACLEAGGKERPMELVLGKLEKNEFFEKVALVWQFEHKSLEGQSADGQRKTFTMQAWQQSQLDLKEWIEKEAQGTDLFQLPTHRGWYWLLNGEIWLPFGRTHPQGEIWQWMRQVAGS